MKITICTGFTEPKLREVCWGHVWIGKGPTAWTFDLKIEDSVWLCFVPQKDGRCLVVAPHDRTTVGPNEQWTYDGEFHSEHA